ncbi:hypothetical protein GT725_01410 [Blautia wexlerae]|uniref:hypothetical protein n=1 Tax=Blautia wexlerae TaxID=418240 RepID=UPI00136FA166|nr:hypothetical protein [Blautia wexlerae]MZT40438.1 hypothetical protein [Blautia wexlerae]MZT48150.1 hypothetical protein [Blautia wexlerae]MZT56838.1 hypothetical protein [Blautia wexlerae]
MKKKLLAGIMALALCSTSIPQMIFAEEFTSEAPEETGETPEVFTDENPATTNDTIGGGHLPLVLKKFQNLMMRKVMYQLPLMVVVQQELVQ